MLLEGCHVGFCEGDEDAGPVVGARWVGLAVGGVVEVADGTTLNYFSAFVYVVFHELHGTSAEVGGSADGDLFGP